MDEPIYRYRARLHRVIDGDTYELHIDLGFRVTARVPVRLRGYNTPERHTVVGKAATEYVTDLISGRDLIVETHKTTTRAGEVRDVQSFARFVADVYVNGIHVGELLAAAGLAGVFEDEKD